MDGRGRKTLVDSVNWPTGLSIDYPARRLYWADPKALSIDSIMLDGRGRQMVHKFPQGENWVLFCTEFWLLFTDLANWFNYLSFKFAFHLFSTDSGKYVDQSS